MANLLSKAELLAANALAELYVVYDNKDYRMTLATLLTLVTKASLELDNVDNTKDVKKPISEKVAEALLTKADSATTATKEQYNALVAGLQNYVTLDALNLAIEGIITSLSNFTTKEEVATAISTALGTLTSAVAALSTAVEDQASRVSTVEAKTENMVITSTMTQAINTATSTLNQTISDLGTSFSDTVSQLDQSIVRLAQSITVVTQGLAKKAEAVHTHTVADVTDLETYVTGLISNTAGSVTAGDPEW